MSESVRHQPYELAQYQSLPLRAKVSMTKTRIRQWYEHFDGDVFVSYSGGKDSTVLLHLVRQLYPDVKAVFSNTGLEYPCIVDMAKKQENITIIRPTWGGRAKEIGKKPDDVAVFRDVVKIFGYPIISKDVSGSIDDARKGKPGEKERQRWQRLTGKSVCSDGRKNPYNLERYMPLYWLPIRITDRCCHIFKKDPIRKYQRKEKLKPYVGTMASESLLRRQSWLKNGCNAYDLDIPASRPLSFWTEQDVLQYILENDLEIASVYGDIVYDDPDGMQYSAKDSLCDTSGCCLHCSGVSRTGCMFCCFGLHLEKGETHFQTIKRLYPKIYDYCIGGGEWVENQTYSKEYEGNGRTWNPKKIWQPNNQGLGLGKVFEMVNEIYGKDFFRYE